MGWKLDNIDFKTYGVGVVKSSGVLDMPRIVDVSTDWPDQDGRDYWQYAADVKYQEREISLNCWIKASGYADFKSKVAAFYAALVAPGERTLTTVFGNEIDVTVQQAVQLVRKTRYVSSLQIGMFTLRLTVAGDSLAKLITIYRSDGVAHGVYGCTNVRLSQALQGSDTITFDIELNGADVLGRGDYILYNGAKYIAFEFPEIDKYSTNKRIYKCQFEHEFFRLRDVIFFVLGVGETPWYANLSQIVDRIIVNAERRFPGVFVKGTVEDTIYINHQFSGQKCLDVLQSTAAAYELEWGYRIAAGKVQINVQTATGSASGLTFAYGKENQLYSIFRTSTQRELMCTHLYAYGAARNIPVDYKGGGRNRLELATMPMVHDFYGEVHEVYKLFDDIFPHRTGTVSSYAYTPSPDPVNYPEKATYKLTDSSMPFDLKAKDGSGNTIYLINGTTAKMRFNTGDLAGFEFEVFDYDHATFTFTLTPLKQSGVYYPNADLYPATGDEYILIDVNPYTGEIATAEEELRVAALAYQNEYWTPKVTFKIPTKPGYDPGSILPGDSVTISDPDANFGTSTKRLIDIQRDLMTGIYNLTAADVVTLNNRQKLLNKVEKINKVISAIKMDDVNTQRGSEQTTAELSNKIINPVDEKLNSDQLVRSESIDPRMLAYDTGVPQFYIKDAMLEENVDGNEDKIRMSAGTISITNWRNATKPRGEIAAGYNPTRTWTVAETTIILATKDAYFLYVKVDLTESSTTATVLADINHREVKSEEGYLTYKLGTITSGEEIV
ncbi:MAG TPA: hypothetical protein DCR40_18000 [Prolixibacteraceae bacterium]|nr:hypothetical protein [Prolixibacteraceae bacterium]